MRRRILPLARLRKVLGQSRTVSAPDGREWTIHVAHYRLPRPGEEVDDEDELFEEIMWMLPLRFLLLAPLAAVARRFWLPLFDATIGHRPWIVASAENPPERMVWRATGRFPASELVEEIAVALEHGEERPDPFAAKWVGYDRGAVVLPRKIAS
jgi:hypothetical protein